MLASPTSIDDDNPLRAVSDSVQHLLAEVFREGVDNGDLSERFSPAILSDVVMGTLNGFTMSWALDPEFPISKKLEEARDLFAVLLTTAED